MYLKNTNSKKRKKSYNDFSNLMDIYQYNPYKKRVAYLQVTETTSSIINKVR